LAAAYALLTKNLCEFYNFTDKVVLFVGAGHAQLLDPTVRTKELIAVDRDLGSNARKPPTGKKNRLDSHRPSHSISEITPARYGISPCSLILSLLMPS
jgi:hypothetical protein